MMAASRREFLQLSAGLTAAWMVSSAARAEPAADDAGIPIVDTHQHLWDLKKFKMNWLQKGTKLDRDFLSSDYLAATDGLNVVKAVYMEVDVFVEQQDEEVAYITEVCQSNDNPTVAAVVSGRPNSPDFKKYLARHKDNKYLRGIRQVLHDAVTPAGYCLSDEFVAGIRALGEMGWSFDLCMRSEELADGAKLVKLCPDTRFVLDHCGNASVHSKDLTQWKRDMQSIASLPNVIGKVSGVIASGADGSWTQENMAPIVNHTLDVFGPERVVFGGDWPVCTLGGSYAEWVTVLKQIIRERPAAEQRQLFHDNAVKFYQLT